MNKREYKFRGKTPDTKIWLYGHLCRDLQGNWYISESGVYGWVKVDPDTVGQWTGRKDSAGIEVYEGEVIEEDGAWYRVEWDEGDCSWRASGIGDTESIGLGEIVSYSWIHELPEELKGQ